MGEYLTYNIKDISVVLPEEHLLDVYQGTHPLYNEFQWFLVRNLEDNATIIEVGANVGDIMTLTLQSNPRINYIAIEGDSLFFEYLKINSEITTDFLSLQPNQIRFVSDFIAKDLTYSEFSGSGGTRSGVLSSDLDRSVATRSLDDIYRDLKPENLRLLMVDVDGFDFDVINSSMETVSEVLPIIFFEMTVSRGQYLEDYFALIRDLQNLGYESMSVLDNFGNLLFSDCTLDVLRQLCSYIMRQNLNMGTRTIYYLDILISHKKDKGFQASVVDAYTSQ